MYLSVNRAIIGSGNGLFPVFFQVVVWTNDSLLWIGHFENKFQWNFNYNTALLHKKINLKIPPAKWKSPFLSLNVLRFNKINTIPYVIPHLMNEYA